MRNFLAAAVATTISTGAVAQTPPSPVALAGGSHAEHMRSLDVVNGVWAGEAVSRERGVEVRLWQTERIGPMLNGDLRVIEGRGYATDGAVVFNALGVVSWNAQTQRHELRSYAAGRAGVFPFTVTGNGYIWEIPAGPMTIRYTATVEGDRFREVGERIVAGQPPAAFFEMNLRRLGDTDWPAGGAVPATAGR